jgi:diguanylate cyclase (GGDEF)-like protein
MAIQPTAERRVFIAYSAILGTGGLLLAVSQSASDAETIPSHLLEALLFSLLIGFSWRFPFSLLPRARMSMDYVFIITALAVLPPPIPFVAGAGAVLLGAVFRRGERPGMRPGPALTGLNAGILFTTFSLGSYLTERLGNLWDFSRLSWRNSLAVLFVFLVLNLLAVLLLSAAVHQRGGNAREFVRHHLLFISPLEIFSIPLILSLISLYVKSGLPAFLCLSSSLLLVSWVFHRLSRVEDGLRRSHQNLEDRTAELAALNSIGREVTASLDPLMVCTVVSRYCRQVFPGGTFFIALADPESRQVTARFVHRGEELRTEERLPVGPGFVEWILKTTRPLMIRDILEEGRALPFPPVLHDPAIRSILMVPLIVEEKGRGIMGVVDPAPGRYDIHRLSVFATIAQQAAVAIQNARHYQLATVDQLTELYLRHHFLQRLSDERTRSQRYRSPFAVLMIDLDTFKEVNDRHGHNSGDRFLSLTADAIRRSLRGPDIACRWGGDEFCVLLPQTDLDAARSTAERIRKEVEALSVSVPGIHATASVGISTYPNDFEGSLEELVRRADQALYRAKREGRDRVAVFSQGTTEAPPAEAGAASTLRSR